MDLAHADFVKIRLGGVDSAGQPGLAGTGTPKDADATDNSPGRSTYYIIAAVVAAASICLFVCVLLFRSRRRRTHKSGATMIAAQYHGLQHPAPPMDMNAPPQYNQASYHAHQPSYGASQPYQATYDASTYTASSNYHNPYDRR